MLRRGRDWFALAFLLAITLCLCSCGSGPGGLIYENENGANGPERFYGIFGPPKPCTTEPEPE